MMIEQVREETMQDTVNTIAQLATATASDCVTVATLTTTNAKLATQLEAAQAHIAQFKDEISALKNKIKPSSQGQRPHKTMNNDSYCWSHGYQVSKSHTSATCNMKKSGHKDAATKSNPMIGVQWDRLLPLAVIILNMLRTSRFNPKLSASTHIDGQFVFQRSTNGATRHKNHSSCTT
jgi:hypothetical protein